jgi:tRNA 2-thiouridine synthesizing protein A
MFGMMESVTRRARLFGRGDRRTGRPPAGGGEGPGAAERTVVAAAGPAALTIDALGRKCPVPIIMLAERIRDVPLGALVAVLADDPAAYTDVPAWCAMKSHEFAGHAELPRGWALFIRRRV